MTATIISKARDIIDADEHLTDEQVIRCIQSANIDSLNWEAVADADDLPEPSEIHLDWSIDADLKDAGVTPERMQVLSFNIARQRAVTKALEALAAL
jgi:hypothetical protein